MLFALLFFGELIFLFWISQILTRQLSRLFYRLTKSVSVTVNLLALLFFPGTVIHELSHFLMAALLFVPVGHIELWPKIEGDSVKLGTVAVAQTDIFRRFLIGAAPLIFGIALLLGSLFYAVNNNLFENHWFIFLMGYVAFEIGNTMFSSKKDMEGALELLAVLVIFAIIFYFLGLRLPTVNLSVFFENPVVLKVFQQGSLFLLIPLAIDLLILLFLKLSFKRS